MTARHNNSVGIVVKSNTLVLKNQFLYRPKLSINPWHDSSFSTRFGTQAEIEVMAVTLKMRTEPRQISYKVQVCNY